MSKWWGLAVVLMLLTGEAHTQAIGGRGGNGFDMASFVGGCEEGRRGLFTETDRSGDRQVTVLRVCRNGSYYDLSDYVYDPRIKCQEGRVELWHKQGKDGKDAVVKCIKGKWVQLY